MTEHLIEGTNESIHDSLGDAVSRGYRTIILITDRPSFLDDIALVAEDKNMLDGDYFWVVSGDAFPPALSPHLRYEVGSPADKLLRGAALFTNYDRFVYEGETNKFLQEWRKQPASLVEDLNTMQPHDQHGNPHYLADVTYFQDETPTEYSSFIYDAIITAGISACKAKNDMENDHMHHVLRTQLNGASGPLAFYDKDKGEYETSRNAEGVLFGMYNVRPGPVDENNMRG